MPGAAVQHLSSARSTGRRIGQGAGGTTSVYRLGRTDIDRQRGFQVFSLAKLRRIKEEGVHFASHVDGRKLFIGPEESMRIQSHLGSTIAMAFDECVENPAAYTYAKDSCARTTRWLRRCRNEMQHLNSLPDTLNPHQMLFGINQGCTYEDLRVAHMQEIAAMDLDGYAIGGLARGGTRRRHVSDHRGRRTSYAGGQAAVSHGVGTPENILEGVSRGVDLFDCVMPARNARHGHVFTWSGHRNMLNQKYERDMAPLDEECDCPTCRPSFPRVYPPSVQGG